VPVPTPDRFATLGLFVREAFLDPAACAAICAEMAAAPASPAHVAREAEQAVESTVRRTLDVRVTGRTRASLEQAIDGLVPALAAHFAAPLTRLEDIHFLRYRPGDFFAPHTDSADDDGARPAIRARRVSMVIFLNGHARQPTAGRFSGGALRLFGLVKDQPAFASLALPLYAEPGLLVGFPSALRHAVEPVTAGERLCVVAWLAAQA
jgi:predicted 2-oxoglutarate/Fe(II)-dependent dioxygenase YbiX